MDDNEQLDLASAPPVSLGADVPVCRALPATAEFRADTEGDGEDGSPGVMFGHFSTFNDWYEINSWFEGNFLERIAPGAFKRTIKNRSDGTPIRVLLEHGFDPQVGDKPLGVPSVLEERDGGPYAEVPLFDTSYNRDLAPALRAGAYGQSFRFAVLRDEWVEEPEPSIDNPKGIPERTIKEVRLIEFGPTVFPANPNADAGLRSTTDAFYERLRSRQPEKYAELVARSASIRLPQTPSDPASVETEVRTTEDPQTRHSEDSPEQARQDANPARHSEDPPTGEHSTATRSSTDQKETATMDENMTVEERKARQAEIRSRQQEIDADYVGSTLPEDVQAEWNALRSEYDEHDAAIEAATERMAYLAELAARQEGENPNTPGRRFARTAPAVHTASGRRAPENLYDLTAYRRQARSMDELGDLYRDGAARVVEAGTYPGVRDRDAARAQAMRLLDSVDDKNGTLARRIIATGSPAYARAFGKAVMSGSDSVLTTEERTALSTTLNAGGYAVPFDLDPTVILTSSGVINPLRAISRVVQVVGNTWQGLTNAGITVSRSAEASEVSDNSPGAFAQPEVKVERVTGFIPFSMEIDQDWSALRSEMTTMLQDAKDTEEADSFLNGDGNSPNAEGLLTGATTLVPLATTNVLASSDLYAIEEALSPRYRTMARWLGNRSFFNTVRSLGADSDGGNLWVRLADGLPPELIGYPVHEASEMPALQLNVDAAPLAVFGDFRHFLIVDKVGMNVELVPHLLGANRRPTGQRGILAVWRNNSKVLVNGAFRVLVGNDGV